MTTPFGVPVAMMVPAFRVIPRDRVLMISAMPWISMPVLLFCRSSPFTVVLMASRGGKAISSAVTMQGPMGVKPSRLFPKYHCLCRV